MTKILKKDILRTVITKREIVDITGWTISSGATVHIIDDNGPKHPTEGYVWLRVRIDNGTGMLDLMPEAFIKNTDI